jgi:hypothetical protein
MTRYIVQLGTPVDVKGLARDILESCVDAGIFGGLDQDGGAIEFDQATYDHLASLDADAYVHIDADCNLVADGETYPIGAMAPRPTQATRPAIEVVPLRRAAEILGVGTRAAESALRHAGIRSGYPLASVEWLAANRPDRGARTDLPASSRSGFNPDNDRPGYLLGRLLATMEVLESAATGVDPIMTRSFGLMRYAPTNPGLVLKSWQREGRQLMRKLALKDPLRATPLIARIEDLVERIGEVPDLTGNTEEQSLLVVGYHHQRHADTQTRRAPSARCIDCGQPAAGDDLCDACSASVTEIPAT